MAIDQPSTTQSIANSIQPSIDNMAMIIDQSDLNITPDNNNMQDSNTSSSSLSIDLDFPIPDNIEMGATLGTFDHQETLVTTPAPNSQSSTENSSYYTPNPSPHLQLSRSVSPIPSTSKPPPTQNDINRICQDIRDIPTSTRTIKGKGKEKVTEPTEDLSLTDICSTSYKAPRPRNNNTPNSREDAAFKRLYEYKDKLLLEDSEQSSIDNIDNTNPHPILVQ